MIPNIPYVSFISSGLFTSKHALLDSLKGNIPKSSLIAFQYCFNQSSDNRSLKFKYGIEPNQDALIKCLHGQFMLNNPFPAFEAVESDDPSCLYFDLESSNVIYSEWEFYIVDYFTKVISFMFDTETSPLSPVVLKASRTDKFSMHIRFPQIQFENKLQIRDFFQNYFFPVAHLFPIPHNYPSNFDPISIIDGSVYKSLQLLRCPYAAKVSATSGIVDERTTLIPSDTFPPKFPKVNWLVRALDKNISVGSPFINTSSDLSLNRTDVLELLEKFNQDRQQSSFFHNTSNNTLPLNPCLNKDRERLLNLLKVHGKNSEASIALLKQSIMGNRDPLPFNVRMTFDSEPFEANETISTYLSNLKKVEIRSFCCDAPESMEEPIIIAVVEFFENLMSQIRPERASHYHSWFYLSSITKSVLFKLMQLKDDGGFLNDKSSPIARVTETFLAWAANDRIKFNHDENVAKLGFGWEAMESKAARKVYRNKAKSSSSYSSSFQRYAHWPYLLLLLAAHDSPLSVTPAIVQRLTSRNHSTETVYGERNDALAHIRSLESKMLASTLKSPIKSPMPLPIPQDFSPSGFLPPTISFWGRRTDILRLNRILNTTGKLKRDDQLLAIVVFAACLSNWSLERAQKKETIDFLRVVLGCLAGGKMETCEGYDKYISELHAVLHAWFAAGGCEGGATEVLKGMGDDGMLFTEGDVTWVNLMNRIGSNDTENLWSLFKSPDSNLKKVRNGWTLCLEHLLDTVEGKVDDETESLVRILAESLNIKKGEKVKLTAILRVLDGRRSAQGLQSLPLLGNCLINLSRNQVLLGDHEEILNAEVTRRLIEKWSGCKWRFEKIDEKSAASVVCQFLMWDGCDTDTCQKLLGELLQDFASPSLTRTIQNAMSIIVNDDELISKEKSKRVYI